MSASSTRRDTTRHFVHRTKLGRPRFHPYPYQERVKHRQKLLSVSLPYLRWLESETTLLVAWLSAPNFRYRSQPKHRSSNAVPAFTGSSCGRSDCSYCSNHRPTQDYPGPASCPQRRWQWSHGMGENSVKPQSAESNVTNEFIFDRVLWVWLRINIQWTHLVMLMYLETGENSGVILQRNCRTWLDSLDPIIDLCLWSERSSVQLYWSIRKFLFLLLKTLNRIIDLCRRGLRSERSSIQLYPSIRKKFWTYFPRHWIG